MPSPPSSRTISPAPPAAKPPLVWQRVLFDYAPPLLLMLAIFIASTDVGSAEHSGTVISRLLAWLGLEQWITPVRLDTVNHYVRKLSHLTEYALLAGLLHRALAATHLSPRAWRTRWAVRPVLVVLGWVALYAASDEFHQRFVSSRTPSIWDVLLDIAGGGVGL